MKIFILIYVIIGTILTFTIGRKEINKVVENFYTMKNEYKDKVNSYKISVVYIIMFISIIIQILVDILLWPLCLMNTIVSLFKTKKN